MVKYLYRPNNHHIEVNLESGDDLVWSSRYDSRKLQFISLQMREIMILFDLLGLPIRQSQLRQLVLLGSDI
jgi:hypothetical protein